VNLLHMSSMPLLVTVTCVVVNRVSDHAPYHDSDPVHSPSLLKIAKVTDVDSTFCCARRANSGVNARAARVMFLLVSTS
jgi:hypothetical protein